VAALYYQGEIMVDSYGFAAFRSRRHDSFNRQLADDLAAPDRKIGGFHTGSHFDQKTGAFSGNWMRQNLARIKRPAA
jgi:hypothetical protein